MSLDDNFIATSKVSTKFFTRLSWELNSLQEKLQPLNGLNLKLITACISFKLNFFFSVAPSLILAPENQTVTESGTATFHCNATGNPNPRITWIKDGMALYEGDTLSIKTNRNHSGKYWCLAENGLNPAVNASANLDVQCKNILVKFFNG